MLKHKLILTENTTLEEAIEYLDKNGNGVLPVVDRDNLFVGLVTDGDIRKAILNKHLDLDHIINKHSYKLNVESTKEQRIQYLKKIKRRHLPLVDGNNMLVDLFTFDDIEFNSKLNSVVIMAGGLGARLGDLTRHKPKPMLHVGKKPILENIIENFLEHGFNRFYISVNYKSEAIKEYFRDGQKWGANIQYLEEEIRLGTAGSISLIDDEITEPIVVANGDVLTTLDFDELLNHHLMTKAAITVCVRSYQHSVPYGVIETEGDFVKSLIEKPKYNYNISAGIYVIDPCVVSYIPKNKFYDMPELVKTVIETGRDVAWFEVLDYWVDLGRVEDLERANSDYDFRV